MKKIWPYLITPIICVAFSLSILLINDAFNQNSLIEWMGNLSDAFFVPGLLVVCFGALVVSTNGGTFDMLTFGVIKLFDLFKKNINKSKYRDFYEYRQHQQEKKKEYNHFLIVGGVFTVVGIVFLIIYNSLI
jgi:hypothetical protein